MNTMVYICYVGRVILPLAFLLKLDDVMGQTDILNI